jgi:hypothetical protein
VLQVKGCNAKAISRAFQKFSIVTLFVTLGRRPSAMVVRQREPPGSSEGVRTRVGSTAGQPGVRMAFRFAYVARTMNNPRQIEESVR